MIYGNGYYFKYYPTSTVLDDNTDFVSVTGVSDKAAVFCWFDTLESSTNLVGNIYVYSANVDSLIIKVKQLTFPSQSYSASLYLNGTTQQSSIIFKTDNFLEFNL